MNSVRTDFPDWFALARARARSTGMTRPLEPMQPADLRRRRKALRLSQAAAAELMALSREQVGRIERGEATPEATQRYDLMLAGLEARILPKQETER